MTLLYPTLPYTPALTKLAACLLPHSQSQHLTSEEQETTPGKPSLLGSQKGRLRKNIPSISTQMCATATHGLTEFFFFLVYIIKCFQ